jgi:hypothetical protein
VPRPASPPFSLRAILLLALTALLPSHLRATDEAAAWEFVARHLPGDALAHLGKPRANPPREESFARAVILMDTQPLTDARLQQAERQFAALSTGDDEIACAAAYLIGRLHQIHFPAPDPARAAREFTALAARHPASYWAQLGLVKLALLQLYVLPEPAAPETRVAAAEAFLPRLTVPGLKRDLHIVLARARLFHGLPGVLPHLLAGERIGGLGNVPRADLQIQIGELSRRAGNWEQARVFFQRFLDENEVDARAYQVKMKLAEIAAHLPAAPAPAR